MRALGRPKLILGVSGGLDSTQAAQQSVAGELCILPVKMKAPVQCGVLDPRNARYVLDTLDAAILMTLPTGAYTAQASCNGGSGDVLVETYAVD